MGNTAAVETAAGNPNVIVRVGTSAAHKPDENISYSIDAGTTWQPCASSPAPQSRAGSIAVSADGSVWVWTPKREAAFVTQDHGRTWKAVQGLPEKTRVIADPRDQKAFFAISLAGRTFYRSADAGATFKGQPFTLSGSKSEFSGSRGDARGGQDRIYATPGQTGDLWLAAFDGLYHAAKANGSVAFAATPDVSEIHAFGFGKGATGQTYPALYLVGTVKGQPGIFRSDDEAHSWVRINDDAHQWGLVLQVAGDPRIYGRVYVGTHGRGIFYGDPAN
jgi:photosystem II stability/assembly factor-like uncharacterized protein